MTTASKTLRVSLETYKRVMDFASKRGISLQDAADFLLCGEVSKERAERLEELEQDLKGFFGEEYLEALIESGMLFEELEGLKRLGDRWREIAPKYEAFKAMFPCKVCGKPMSWEPGDNLGQALKKYVAEHGWGHTSCINQKKA